MVVTPDTAWFSDLALINFTGHQAQYDILSL